MSKVLCPNLTRGPNSCHLLLFEVQVESFFQKWPTPKTTYTSLPSVQVYSYSAKSQQQSPQGYITRWRLNDNKENPLQPDDALWASTRWQWEGKLPRIVNSENTKLLYLNRTLLGTEGCRSLGILKERCLPQNNKQRAYDHNIPCDSWCLLSPLTCVVRPEGELTNGAGNRFSLSLCHLVLVFDICSHVEHCFC